MLNLMKKSLALITLITLQATSMAHASDAAKGKTPMKRKAASNSYSGARVRSSGLFEVGSVSNDDIKVDVSSIEEIKVLKEIKRGSHRSC